MFFDTIRLWRDKDFLGFLPPFLEPRRRSLLRLETLLNFEGTPLVNLRDPKALYQLVKDFNLRDLTVLNLPFFLNTFFLPLLFLNLGVNNLVKK